jgi:hypothetical protein
MIGGSIANRIKDKYKKSKAPRLDRKRMKRNKKVNWKTLTNWR